MAYEETRNEKVKLALRELTGIKARHHVAEQQWREEERIEALRMINELPHAVRVWILSYQDKENA